MKGLDSDVASQETLVMDAVFAFAHALNSLYNEICRGKTPTGLCLESIDGDKVVQAILASNFTSLADGRVTFLQNGDVAGTYSVLHLERFSDDNYTFVPVGKWNERIDSKTVIQQKVPWQHLKENFSWDGATGVPRSVCSEPCDVGERINIDADYQCCWTCSPCHNNEIVVNNNTECRSCIDKDKMIFAWPNEDSSKCMPLEPDENTWATAIIVLSVLGLVVTVVIIVLYTFNCQNALIKASSRDLSYIMFIGKSVRNCIGVRAKQLW